VALVLHRAGGYIACHHCGHREQVPARCCDCGSATVGRHGAGTERLQHDLAHVFDDGRFPVFRLDADVVGDDDGVGTILRRFEAADCGVLIGTQMVAKGHDFPDVTLGVVVDADATLRFPDFRAEERTFALIAQLAGRVGRGSDGRVLVQTIAPEARAIMHAARHNSGGFVAGELERRRALGYPPFCNLIRITCSATDGRAAQAAAAAVSARLRGAFRGVPAAPIVGNGTLDVAPTVLGPAALFRLRGRERRVIVVKAAQRGPAAEAVGDAVQQVASSREHSGVSFGVDVDPQ
jgi:primosomal protein N' (replication factor Y)